MRIHLLLASCLTALSLTFAARSQEPTPPPHPVPVPTPAQEPQQPAPATPAQHPPTGQEPAHPTGQPITPPAAPEAQEPGADAAAPERGNGRGRRGRRGGPGGGDGGPEGRQGPGGDDQDAEGAVPEPKPDRRGLRVDDLLVQTYCARCHARDAKGLMTRISYVRKSPEGWSESIKRMIRLHGLQIGPSDAKQVVRYLADQHGLTRSEAERSLYESERRVHWSEEHEDDDFREACSVCHTLGRVLAQARDPEEWQQLRATHVAMFPLARGQMGGGPPPEDEERFGPGRNGGGGGGGRATGRRGGATPVEATANRGGPQPRQGDRGDRVLASLADKQPLFTPEWETWSTNRREVPLAGTWTVTGHELGRGDLLGTAELVRTDDGEYEVHWQLTMRNGDRIDRRGKGILYGGYSWRGRSTDPGDGGRTWREVLLLDDRWSTLRGRFFTGDSDEIGVDVTMLRQRGAPRALAVETPWVTVPAKDHEITVFGEQFPEGISADEFHLGRGVTVQRCERLAANQVKLWLDVAPGTPCGPRDVAYGNEPAVAQIQLYDGVDYVRIRPTQGLARIGGANVPKQIERFEAVAVHRGPDEKPFTDDDVDLWMVPTTWRLVEAIVRDDDDDLQYVGAIDPATGVFTPAIDGPNLQRKWMANNTGEVYVECELSLMVPVRPTPPPPVEKPAEKPADKPAEQPGEPGEPGAEPTPPPPPPPPPPPVAEPEDVPSGAAPVLEQRTFKARASLLVTVPQYIRWTRLEWEDR